MPRGEYLDIYRIWVGTRRAGTWAGYLSSFYAQGGCYNTKCSMSCSSKSPGIVQCPIHLVGRAFWELEWGRWNVMRGTRVYVDYLFKR